MGTGYTRADTSDNIANGNVIDADDLDTEFNAVESAFSSSSGHTHDGTAAEGAPITVLGPAQDVVATTSVLRPKTTNTVDLGTSSLKYKDAYLAGDLNIGGAVTSSGAVNLGSTSITGTLAVSTNTTLTGTLAVNGNTTLGDAASDTVTVNADIASNIIPSADDTYDLGASDAEWKDLYIDGTAYIDTGSIDIANIATLNVSGTITGDVTGDLTGAVTGNADTATALATPRTISISGITSASVNFDGSGNVNLDASALTLGGTEVTSTGAELNILDGVTATTAELNLLDGVTASTAEINFIDGVTSNIQTQLNTKLDSLSTYTGDIDISGELVVTSYNETFATITSSSNAATINCEAGNVFSHTLTENTTYTFSNPPSSGTAYGFTLKIIQDSSASGYTITWPNAVDWTFGYAPNLSSGASEVDQFVFYTHDGGTTWYGFLAGRRLG